MFDYLVVGAGLFGATVSRELLDAGKSVMVIDKRHHIGGNCYTEVWDGITVSLYGGHAFHTNSRRIWNYVQAFADWQQYENRVKASYKGVIYSFPPNLMTYQQMGEAWTKNGPAEVERRFLVGYSTKQWARPYSEIPKHILKRIPMRTTWDDRYFTDDYQGLPIGGYTPMIERMLSGCAVELMADYLADLDYWRGQARQVIYTGPIDALYYHCLGKLEYRSLEFTHSLCKDEDVQGCPTINYTDINVPYTRRMEWKHWWKASSPVSWITEEYPAAYDGCNEPYYPVGDERSRELYRQYRQMAEVDGYIVGGRLGSYQYLNMDQAIASALKIVEGL
jgi:UDP-galactopyranose mutase